MITKIVGFCSILATIAAFAFWNGSIESRVSANENDKAVMKKQINDMHWFLIERNNVQVPKEK